MPIPASVPAIGRRLLRDAAGDADEAAAVAFDTWSTLPTDPPVDEE